MPSFGTWEREVLMHTYDDIDFISCHAYYEERAGDLGSFLASATDMDAFIESVVATIDHVKAVKRSDHVVYISFDEWNVWYNDRFERIDKITDAHDWPRAPRLLEDVYTVADAVVVGNLLISLLRRADRVRSASLAQLVNVIAPIMTEPGGIAWRQTTFFPFAITSRLARGLVLQTRVDCETYETKAYGRAAIIDATTVHDAETGRLTVFIVNRSITDDVELEIDISALGPVTSAEAETLSDRDPYAANTLVEPRRVQMHANETLLVDRGRALITLPPVSWTAITLTPLRDDDAPR
jgi:alpha-N-arabinofuranosidase